MTTVRRDTRGKRVEGLAEGDGEEDAVFDIPITLQPDLETGTLQLVGRVCTEKVINRDAFLTMMKNLWRPRFGMEGVALKSNLFLFKFKDNRDTQRILLAQPWVFERCLVILANVPATMQPAQVSLFHVPLWIQVHELPIGGYSIDVARVIGGMLGDFITWDESDDLRGVYMRIRVCWDVRNNLLCSRRVRFRDGTLVKVSFKYERLGSFCYKCGGLDHIDRDCDIGNEDEVSVALTPTYGSWLRAPPRKPIMVSVDSKHMNRTSGLDMPLRKGTSKSPTPVIVMTDSDSQWLDEVQGSMRKVSLLPDDVGRHKELGTSTRYIPPPLRNVLSEWKAGGGTHIKLQQSLNIPTYGRYPWRDGHSLILGQPGEANEIFFIPPGAQTKTPGAWTSMENVVLSPQEIEVHEQLMEDANAISGIIYPTQGQEQVIPEGEESSGAQRGAISVRGRWKKRAREVHGYILDAGASLAVHDNTKRKFDPEGNSDSHVSKRMTLTSGISVDSSCQAEAAKQPRQDQ